VNAKDYEGGTALMLASWYGGTDVMKLLLEHKADVNAKDKTGRTALMSAADAWIFDRTPDVMRVLIDAGAEVNAKDMKGRTPLIYAVKGELPSKEEGPEALLQGSDIKSEPWGFMAPDTIANPNLRAVKTLLENRAEVNVQDQFGATALIWAARQGFLHTIKELLKAGANLEAKDMNGNTALTVAQASLQKETEKETESIYNDKEEQQKREKTREDRIAAFQQIVTVLTNARPSSPNAPGDSLR
jgi:ankyrin repeat protein